MTKNNSRLLAAATVLALLLGASYFFSPYRKHRLLSEALSPYQCTTNLSDFLNLITPEHGERINGLIGEAQQNSRTDFHIVLLPDTLGYSEKDILGHYFRTFFHKNKQNFQVFLLLFPRQGILSFEIDQRLRYAIDETLIERFFNDILVASFRKSELEYAENLKGRDNLKSLHSSSISEGIYDTLFELNREIQKQLPSITDRLEQEKGIRSWTKARYWMIYTMIFIAIFGLINHWLKTHCPRCSNRMTITRIKNPEGMEFRLIKCFNCGYMRRRKSF
ncbi:MAG: hypothetical protein PHQ23_10150 [Candidatus Wallbacteria bacterium]|nr:hypothetical protein [Candidatus Wallbacteria bacterium]